ncbi:MAG TPA: hypothetical protein VG943_15790 [Caulobacterales bacterium]|nr:hypothetical protein [Caulobacterales bacterium]
MDSNTTTYSGDEQAAMAMVAGMIGPIILIALIALVVTIFVQWKIFSKAGYSGALSLLNLIPIIGPLIMMIVWIWFAFADWPNLKKETAA